MRGFCAMPAFSMAASAVAPSAHTRLLHQVERICNLFACALLCCFAGFLRNIAVIFSMIRNNGWIFNFIHIVAGNFSVAPIVAGNFLRVCGIDNGQARIRRFAGAFGDHVAAMPAFFRFFRLHLTFNDIGLVDVRVGWAMLAELVFAFLPLAALNPEEVIGGEVLFQAEDAAMHAFGQKLGHLLGNIPQNFQIAELKGALQHEHIAVGRKIKMGRAGIDKKQVQLLFEKFFRIQQFKISHAFRICELAENFSLVFVHDSPSKLVFKSHFSPCASSLISRMPQLWHRIGHTWHCSFYGALTAAFGTFSICRNKEQKMRRYSIKDQFTLAFCRLGIAGLAPRAPGTWGTALACLLAPVLFFPLSPGWRCVVLGAVFIAGGMAATRAEEILNQKDPGQVVIDELAGVWLVFLPYREPTFRLILAGFIFFRIFDIFKPWPVKASEDWFPDGFGVMIDDIVAGLWALLCVQALFWIGLL